MRGKRAGPIDEIRTAVWFAEQTAQAGLGKGGDGEREFSAAKSAGWSEIKN